MRGAKNGLEVKLRREKAPYLLNIDGDSSMHRRHRQQDKNKQVDMLILDFTNAFDTVPHHRLLMKLKYYGIDNNLHRWISS